MKKLFLLSAILILGITSVFAQNFTQQSYRQAREILDKSVAAYGGLQNLRSIQNFSVKLSGDTVQRNQSRRTGMAERTPYNFEMTLDLKTRRIYQMNKGGYPGGFSYQNGFVSDGKDAVAFDFIRKTTLARPNVPPAAFRQRLRWLPQFSIVDALERASRLRYLGKADFEKRAHDVVSYSNEDGLEVSLYIDEKTNLLSKIEWLGTDAFSGDVVTETIFAGYRDEKNYKVPTGRITKVGDELVEELRYDEVVFNTALTDDKFKVPADFKAAATVPPTEPVSKLAENVYTVLAGGYNVLFVAFKDYIFVMESPGNDNVSKQAIEQIKKTVPNKPIRYIAVTHHHDDHAGGLRTYIAEGATVIALPGEKSFFEKVVKNKFTITPDALTLNPQPLRIETIENGKRVLTDGTTIVELYDIGSGPHTEEMLVAYLPNEKIIFQGDLLNRPSNGDYPIANDTTAHFAKWIETKKLAIEKIVAVHGTISTMDELRKAVADMQQAKK